jgi:hypothetical protein
MVLSKTSGEMKKIMKRLQRFWRRRNLVLNVKKSKTIVFRRGRGRENRKMAVKEGEVESERIQVSKIYSQTKSRR